MADTLVKKLGLTCVCGGRVVTRRAKEYYGEAICACCPTCGRYSDWLMVTTLDMYGYDRLAEAWDITQGLPSPRANLGYGDFWYDADGKKIGNW